MNFLDYLKYMTALFNGRFDPEEYNSAQTAQAVLEYLVKLIEVDNGAFRFVLVDPRIYTVWRHVVAPIPPSNHKFWVQEDQITLKTTDQGRKEEYYYFGDLPIWGPTSKKKMLKGEWGPTINVLWSTIESAQAIAFIHIPDAQYDRTSDKRSDPAKRLCKLAEASCIRSSGEWCNGQVADAATQKWAKDVWPFPVSTPLQGAKGVLAICDGAMVEK